MTGSGCSSDRGAGWSATKRSATPCSGPTTYSTMPRRALLNRCSVFAGGFDLAARARWRAAGDDVHHAGSARRVGAQVASGRRPVLGSDPVLDARDDPPVRRRTTRGVRRVRRYARRARPLFRGSRGRHPRAVGQPTTARGLRRGSPLKWPICVRPFGMPPTTATSTPVRPSRVMQRFWVIGPNSTNPPRGLRNSSTRESRRPPAACPALHDRGPVLHDRSDRRLPQIHRGRRGCHR